MENKVSNQELIELAKQFQRAHSKLLDAWFEANEKQDEIITEKYPFHECFNDLLGEVDEWVENIEEKLGEK